MVIVSGACNMHVLQKVNIWYAVSCGQEEGWKAWRVWYGVSVVPTLGTQPWTSKCIHIVANAWKTLDIICLCQFHPTHTHWPLCGDFFFKPKFQELLWKSYPHKVHLISCNYIIIKVTANKFVNIKLNFAWIFQLKEFTYIFVLIHRIQQWS